MKYSRRRRPPTRQEVWDAINLFMPVNRASVGPESSGIELWSSDPIYAPIKQEEAMPKVEKPVNAGTLPGASQKPDFLKVGTPILVSRKPTFIKWEDADTVAEGRFEDMRFVDLTDGACPRYTLKGSDGTRVAFLAPLQVAEALEGIPLGTYVKITYLGKVGRMKDFEVETEEFNPVTKGRLVDGATGELFDDEQEESK